jgi:Spy/CpxP family protein refolding chaperone
MVPMQVERVEASANLLELLEPAAVDEEAALAAADRMMTLELEVKARRMVLLVRIKNLLTAEQQRQLREIRDEGP